MPTQETCPGIGRELKFAVSECRRAATALRGGSSQRSTENQVRRTGHLMHSLFVFDPKSWKEKQCENIVMAFVPNAFAETAPGTLP